MTEAATEAALLIAVGLHVDRHGLADTKPSVHTVNGQVEVRCPWHASRIDAVIRWARSLKCNHIDVKDCTYGHWMTTTGVLGSHQLVVGTYASDVETVAMRDMPVEGVLELDQIARFARSYPGVA